MRVVLISQAAGDVGVLVVCIYPFGQQMDDLFREFIRINHKKLP